MMVLVIGGSGSGKSAYAESCITSLSEGKRKYYLATMQAYDSESQKKIDRHKQFRSGKGFITIEQPRMVQDAVQCMETGEKTALLECVSNLAANEMFAGAVREEEEIVAGKIINGIARLKEELIHLVVVGNNVFEDGIAYDEATMAYIRAMGRIHEKLAELADEVVEVVVGIPVIIKEREKGR